MRFFVITIIFIGSVFLTSGKFVNEMNTPRFYFVVLSLLFTIAFIAISQKRVSFCAMKSKTILWGINSIIFLQACYGLFQFPGWLQSNHSNFAITGGFDNPAGFAALLSMAFPISLFLLTTKSKIERCFAASALMVISFSVILSESRAGILSIIFSSFIFFQFQSKIIRRLQLSKYYKLLSIFFLILLVSGSSILYLHKKESVNGRLLIWKVSTKLIQDSPLYGHGYESFQTKYMDYQAEYFKNNPNSRFKLLADNVKHPFNEFVLMVVEFGIIGLVITLLCIFLVLWQIIKSEHEYRGLVLSGLAAFIVLACFSYPLQYIVIWLLLSFYLSVLLPSKEIEFKNTSTSIISRILIVIACAFFIFHIFRQIGSEIKWKTIAISSLRGNTAEMLPEYERLYSSNMKQNSLFLYNYGAELNIAGRFDKSIDILTECQQRFNDYDLQMLMADNYNKKGEFEMAVQIYNHASNMIPCRYLPLYHIFEIYKNTGQKIMAIEYANKIVNNKIKIPSVIVSSIRLEAEEYLKRK